MFHKCFKCLSVFSFGGLSVPLLNNTPLRRKVSTISEGNFPRSRNFGLSPSDLFCAFCAFSRFNVPACVSQSNRLWNFPAASFCKRLNFKVSNFCILATLGGMYRVTTLRNGLTVATAEMPHMTSVSLGIWIGVGSRYESPAINGICHFIEHLLFKGTKKRSAREISEAVEGIGGSLNAFTSEETTCFHARAGYDRLSEVFDVLADMLLESRFAPPDVVKERNVIKEEIAMYWDEPQHLVHELLNQTLWPKQPLGRPITGTPATLDAISRGHLLSYLRRN